MSSSVNAYLIGLRGKLHEIKYNSRYMMIKYICVYIRLQLLLSRFRRVQLCVTLWTVAHQAPLSMEFSRQEYCSGFLCPPQGDLPNPGTEPRSLALQADSLPRSHQGSPIYMYMYIYVYMYMYIFIFPS